MKVTQVTSEQELKAAFDIRQKVFVQEQGVPLKDEFDDFDEICEHILILNDRSPVGTGRIRRIENAAKLERICILSDYRKFGLGKVIIENLEAIAKNKGLTHIKLHGQVQAKGFYEKLGYSSESDEFMEDGIAHVLMIKDI
ncbi:GNAT family N-acetyltransferase [Halobacillus seohaensis]|uniref:GNAT family N-acetyltransferase n=1 Tax=Halobacillus seohaensis TaxID=447421 RepID=A0ABW2EIV6_9BACI